MAHAFDTLGYSKRLREGGVANSHAEAHAEAARDFIMTELATRADLAAVRADIVAVRTDLQTALETQTLRLTVRLGGIAVTCAGIVAAIIGILAFFLRLH